MFELKNVVFDDESLTVILQDGLSLRQSLKRHGQLAQAEEKLRHQWSLNESNDAIVWPNVSTKGVTLDLFECVWEAVCNHALSTLQKQKWDMSLVSPKVAAVVSLWRLEADGYNGGFLQFFCNWGESNCQTALHALQMIGAHETHQVLMKQRAIIQRLEDSPTLIDLGELPALLTDAERDEIGDQLDHELWDAMEEIPRLAIRHYGWVDLLSNEEKSK